MRGKREGWAVFGAPGECRRRSERLAPGWHARVRGRMCPLEMSFEEVSGRKDAGLFSTSELFSPVASVEDQEEIRMKVTEDQLLVPQPAARRLADSPSQEGKK